MRRTAVLLLVWTCCGLLPGAESASGAGGATASVLAQVAALESEGRQYAALDLVRHARLRHPDDEAVRRTWRRLHAAYFGLSFDDGERAADRDAVQRRLARVEGEMRLARAQELAAEGLASEARARLQQARALFEASGDWNTLAPTYQRISESIALLQQQVEGRAAVTQDEARRRALTEAGTRAEALAAANEATYEQRVLRIIRQRTRDHLELALALARATVSDFPGKEPGETLFNELLEEVHKRREVDIDERLRLAKQEAFDRIHRDMIPHNVDGTPLFPDSWFDVQDQRQAPWVGEAVDLEPWRAAINNRLEASMDIVLEQVPVAEALDQVAHLASINLIVDPAVRGMGGLPVDLRARDMRVRNVLDWICHQADISWRLRNEAIWAGGEVRDETYIRIYDVTQLVRAPKDFPGVDRSVFFNQTDRIDFNEGQLLEADFAPEDIVDLMQQAVAPAVWDDPDYLVTIRGNRLFVRADGDVQDLVEAFIRSQAAQHNQQVFLRLSWLEISDRYIEEIGVDWENNGVRDVLSHPRTNAGFERRQPEWSIVGSLFNNLPDLAINSGRDLVIDAANPAGLFLNWLQLDAFQVSALLTAQQQSRQVRELNEIELCTLHGLRSNVFVGGNRSFISGTTVAGDGNLDTEIDAITFGQSLDVKPLISADRKYVSLELRPILADVDIDVEYITTTRNIDIGDGDDDGLLPFSVQTTIPVELPIVHIVSAGTRVMIPDRGSVLVGGFGDQLEQHASSKIPILGHIPFLGRLFGKRGRYSEQSQLYLRVSARIILYEEEEANL